MKLIVTHVNPDLDAFTSIWLLKRFLPDWKNAELAFVPAGGTFQGRPVDLDSEVLHVDTGLGRLDHHQRHAKITSAAALCWEYLQRERAGQPLSELDREAVTRLVKVVTEIDNARDLSWGEAGQDRFEFYLHSLIYGLKRNIPDDRELVDQGLILLDALWRSFKDKIRAQESIDNVGIRFRSHWGKALAVRTGNEKVLWEAETRGYRLVVKYDPRYKKRVKIYSHYRSRVDLTSVYRHLQKADSEADWFLHPSKKLLLISSHPDARPTRLTLEQIVDLLEKK